MAEASSLPLPYPETAVVAEDSLGEQSLALALELPERPLVLGGCCCAHVGAVEGLGARHGRVAVAWFDAHGDLNTPETSPSGNPWGMPLRMLIDSGAAEAADVVLIGARSLDPAETEFIASEGIAQGAEAIEGALDGTDGVYVALDCDSLEASEIGSFMPEPGGLAVAEAEQLLRDIAHAHPVLGAGLTGLVPEERNVEPLIRLCSALRL